MLQRAFRSPWIAPILSGLLMLMGWWINLPLVGDPAEDLALFHAAARAQLGLDSCRAFFQSRSVPDESPV